MFLYFLAAMELKLLEDNVAFVYENSASDTSYCSKDSDVNDANVYPVMLVTHFGAHVKHNQADISLETVIDHSSDLFVNNSGPKDEMNNFNTSCQSQENLQMSSDELDIPVCAPNMTSSPKYLKVCCCLLILTACIQNYVFAALHFKNSLMFSLLKIRLSFYYLFKVGGARTIDWKG